jgi:glyoxylase-like metal-dependent hydrolase (beta-lactamase superfamily II)
LLIDTGIEASGQELIENIKKCGYKLSDIEFIIATHLHPDHTGALATLAELTDARIASHKLEAKYISHESKYPGHPGFQAFQPVKVDDLLKDDQIYQGLLVIHTPGHTPGNIALLDNETNILIAGDSLMTNKERVIPLPDEFNLDPIAYRKSIRKLTQLRFDKLIPGHGHSLHSKGHEKLESFITIKENINGDGTHNRFE